MKPIAHALTLLVIGGALLLNCEVPPPPDPPDPAPVVWAPVVPEDYVWSLDGSDGAGQILGSALLRQRGGGVVTCAGEVVLLWPSGPWSDEWMQKNIPTGFREVLSEIPLSEVSPLFGEYGRSMICDAQGEFIFDDVPVGTWYLMTNVIWMVPGRFGGYRVGGTLVERIHVTEGTNRITLTQ